MKRIVIGTRGSDLALWQTNHIADCIRAAAPDIEVAIEVISTKGDRVLDVPLAEVGGKGLFTKELEAALLEGRADLAVHSLKDVPTELPAGLVIAAVPPRENPLDALISANGEGLDDLREGARVGTSSLRRKVQLLARRPDLEITALRGNVPTRLRKLKEEGLDAIILATAGLKRLGLDGHISQIFDTDVMLPAVGQGALGIEVRSDDAELMALLDKLNDPDTRAATTAERSLLAGMGGGCQVPIGALARVEDGRLLLDACVCSQDGTTVLRCSVEGAAADAVAVGIEAAERLRAEGAGRLMAAAVAAESGEALPLAGKRVVVTRAADQASALVRALEAAGAEPIPFPVIETRAAACEGIGAPDDYDWLVFTSANGVRYFAEALEAAGRDITAFRSVSICAIGGATASALLKLGLPVTLTPKMNLAASVRDAFLAVDGGVEGTRFLLPRGNLARPLLPSALREAGAEVAEAVVYETLPLEVPDAEADALASRAPDFVAFTSSSTARNFQAALGAERIAALGAKYASIGPVTTETARAAGIDIAVEAKAHDVPGLVRAMAEYCRQAAPAKDA